MKEKQKQKKNNLSPISVFLMLGIMLASVASKKNCLINAILVTKLGNLLDYLELRDRKQPYDHFSAIFNVYLCQILGGTIPIGVPPSQNSGGDASPRPPRCLRP